MHDQLCHDQLLIWAKTGIGKGWCVVSDEMQPGRLGQVVRSWAMRFRRVETSADTEAAVLVELAIDAADMADRARYARDDRIYLAAATRLQTLIRAVVHGDSGNGYADTWADEMARAMGAGPGMGHTPQP